jgi:sigma-B regulation protein RsbU (phosphoserine phosphatase)
MEQKKLYRVIDILASKKYENEEELLNDVIEQIVHHQEIHITGGRIWKLDMEKKSYKLMFQTGKMKKIESDFSIRIEDNPIFDAVTEQRTVLADETNKDLLSKGIIKYSASGVGPKTRLNGKKYYEYMLALNARNINDEFRDTINIVATFLTAKIRGDFFSAAQKNLIKDIDQAKQIQRSILPEHEYNYYGYDLFGVTIPADIIGGDFYDYLKIGHNGERLAVVVGDAASKGMGAAAEALYISGAIRMASTFQIKISALMHRLNQLINKIFKDDKFISLFYGELMPDKKGLFLYSNAGHNPPIHYSGKTGSVHLLDSTGPLLGPVPNSKFDTDSTCLAEGDIVVIYTDGIVEAANDKYEFYEIDRLIDVIKKNTKLSSKELVYTILDDVIKFSTSNSKYQDDKTLVVIKKGKR